LPPPFPPRLAPVRVDPVRVAPVESLSEVLVTPERG